MTKRRAAAFFFRTITANDFAAHIADEILRRDRSATVAFRLERIEDCKTFTADERAGLGAYFAAHRAHRAAIAIDYDLSIGDPSTTIAIPISSTKRRRKAA